MRILKWRRYDKGVEDCNASQVPEGTSGSCYSDYTQRRTLFMIIVGACYNLSCVKLVVEPLLLLNPHVDTLPETC